MLGLRASGPGSNPGAAFFSPWFLCVTCDLNRDRVGALSRPMPARVVAADMMSFIPPLVHDLPLVVVDGLHAYPKPEATARRRVGRHIDRW